MVFDFFGKQRRPRGAVVPLTREVAAKVRLRHDSLFDSSDLLASYLQMLEHASAHSGQAAPLAWMRADGSEYILGGRWRRRNDIGEVIELQAENATDAEELLEQLLDAYRQNSFDLVLAGIGEQQRARSFYTRRGFLSLDDVVYYAWRVQSLPELPPGYTALLRPFAAPDLSAVLEVDHAAFPWLWWNSRAEMAWYAGLPDVEIWVLVDETGKIGGYSGSTSYGDKAHLDRLAVHPDLQGRGYGAALLGNALNRLVTLGGHEVTLSTQDDNRRSQRLYSRYGFRRTGGRFQVYGRWLGEPATEPQAGEA